MSLRSHGFWFNGLAFPAILLAARASSAKASMLTTESFALPYGPGNSLSAPYQDMLVGTTPLTTWAEKGAAGLQGSQAQNPSDTGGLAAPATIAFKFNVGSVVDSLNATYGVGDWTIASPKLTMQYTYYANNSVFGGGAGNFETYWVANDSWAFSNAGAAPGSPYSAYNYVAGTDPAYATSAVSLLSWAGSEADLGSTTYNWLSPTNNPNYTSWSTDKTGFNQGLLVDMLSTDPLLVNDITSATGASDPNVSFYLMPTTSTLGLTIFTGGGSSTPTLSFNVVSVPEPALAGLTVVCGASILARRRRRT